MDWINTKSLYNIVMIHIAIMKKQWGLIPKILEGKKVVESRWYKNKCTPWNKIKLGDILYFKNSGEKVSIKAVVTEVDQYEIKSNDQALKVMEKYAFKDLGTEKLSEDIKNYITDKKYAIFVHFKDVEKVEPFDIDKSGFGMQSAWITVNSVDEIQKA